MGRADTEGPVPATAGGLPTAQAPPPRGGSIRERLAVLFDEVDRAKSALEETRETSKRREEGLRATIREMGAESLRQRNEIARLGMLLQRERSSPRHAFQLVALEKCKLELKRARASHDEQRLALDGTIREQRSAIERLEGRCSDYKRRLGRRRKKKRSGRDPGGAEGGPVAAAAPPPPLPPLWRQLSFSGHDRGSRPQLWKQLSFSGRDRGGAEEGPVAAAPPPARPQLWKQLSFSGRDRHPGRKQRSFSFSPKGRKKNSVRPGPARKTTRPANKTAGFAGGTAAAADERNEKPREAAAAAAAAASDGTVAAPPANRPSRGNGPSSPTEEGGTTGVTGRAGSGGRPDLGGRPGCAGAGGEETALGRREGAAVRIQRLARGASVRTRVLVMVDALIAELLREWEGRTAKDPQRPPPSTRGPPAAAHPAKAGRRGSPERGNLKQHHSGVSSIGTAVTDDAVTLSDCELSISSSSQGDGFPAAPPAGGGALLAVPAAMIPPQPRAAAIVPSGAWFAHSMPRTPVAVPDSRRRGGPTNKWGGVPLLQII